MAGSERIKKTNSDGVTLKEAMRMFLVTSFSDFSYFSIDINKSLSFLEQVVIALAEKKR